MTAATPLPAIDNAAMTAMPTVLMPWVELNQGLIASLTLIAALAVAWFEYRRAQNATRDRREEFRQAFISLIDDLSSKPFEDFVRTARLAERLSDAFLASPPPATNLVGEALRLRDQFKALQTRPLGYEPPETTTARRTSELATWRKRIQDA